MGVSPVTGDTTRTADDVPFQTAPEIAREIAGELAFDDETTARAVALAERYGGLDAEPVLTNTPRTVAAGAVYLAALESTDYHLTQQDVADVADRYEASVGECSRAMRSEEYDIPDDDSDSTDADRGLLSQVWRSLTGGGGR